MMLLSIDPGRGQKASIGYCLFDDEGEMERGELDWEGLCAQLQLERGVGYLSSALLFRDAGGVWWLVDTVVIENFVNDPGVRRGGQTNGTSEVIGAVEILATQAGVPFLRRSRTVLPTAMLHFGYVQKGKKLPHADSAYLHGAEYLLEQREKAREIELALRAQAT